VLDRATFFLDPLADGSGFHPVKKNGATGPDMFAVRPRQTAEKSLAGAFKKGEKSGERQTKWPEGTHGLKASRDGEVTNATGGLGRSCCFYGWIYGKKTGKIFGKTGKIEFPGLFLLAKMPGITGFPGQRGKGSIHALRITA